MKKFFIASLLFLLFYSYSPAVAQLTPTPTRSEFAKNSGTPFTPPDISSDDSSIFKFDGQYTGAVIYRNPETRKPSTFKFHQYKRDVFGNYTFRINMREYRNGSSKKSHIKFRIKKSDIIMLSPLPCPWKK